jgi:hypothetical protein
MVIGAVFQGVYRCIASLGAIQRYNAAKVPMATTSDGVSPERKTRTGRYTITDDGAMP